MKVVAIFLTLDEVMAIHQDQIANYGGSLGIRDQGLLDGALAQPESSFDGIYLHPDIYSMAAAYLYHVVMNHPFIDGNKRVGTVSALVFLELNGHELEVSEDLLEKTVFKVASGKMNKEDITKLFKTHTIEL